MKQIAEHLLWGVVNAELDPSTPVQVFEMSGGLYICKLARGTHSTTYGSLSEIESAFGVEIRGSVIYNGDGGV